MNNSQKRWANLEAEATKAGAAPFWSIPSLYTVPQGYLLAIKFISWINDVTQNITLANIKQYKAHLHYDSLLDEGVSFYMTPNFAQFPFPYHKIVDENKNISVYFEASTANTFDYLVVRLCGWLVPKNLPWDPGIEI